MPVMRCGNGSAGEWMRWRYSTHSFAGLGELWLARGDTTKAREHADQCLQIATQPNSRMYLVKGWRLRGKIALARKQWDEAEDSIKRALNVAEAIGKPTQLWITHTALARLYEKMKRPDLQREQWNAATSIIKSTADDLQDEALRSTFLNAAIVREIMDNSKR